jgi:hypothetical protein
MAQLMQHFKRGDIMTKTSSELKDSSSRISNIRKHQDHQHGETCGCKSVKHGDRIDYVHDGHTHRIQGNQVDEGEGELKNPDPLV